MTTRQFRNCRKKRVYDNMLQAVLDKTRLWINNGEIAQIMV